MWKVLFLALLGYCVAERLPSIINGKDVDKPGKYPWQISLQQYGSHICGGSIVDEKWIITAGHCVGSHESVYRVVVGLHDMKRRFGSPVQHSVKKVYLHEKYGKGWGSTPNDIAMIELNDAIEYNEFVQPILIDEKGSFDEKSQCVITGWGYTLEGKKFVTPPVLQEAETTIISQFWCKFYWKIPGMINDGHVCLRNKKTGGCMGDSGGPLACRNGDGPWSNASWHLVGATSWGSGKCNVNKPSVYTRISYFRDWIKTTSGL